MSTLVSYLRKVLAFSLFVAVFSSLPIGAAAPEYKTAYLVADEGAQSGPQISFINEEPLLAQSPEKKHTDELTDSIPEIPRITAPPQVVSSAREEDNSVAAVGGATPTHVVVPGDTLSGIATKYKLTVAQISALNGITNPNMIRPGQKLLLAEEPPQPRTHVVRNGENLSYIATTYGVSVAAIVQLNDFVDINRLKIGQVITIPGASSGTLASRGAVSTAGMIWPVIGTISSYFGPRWGTLHTGLDVAAPSGTDIKAARAGRVESAGWLGGYGYAVVIDHGDGLKTLYGHASRLLVKAGDRVVQGQVVARVGSTGNSTGPHLHFEVRINNSYKDPLKYLPGL